jgi:hypothetical protein
VSNGGLSALNKSPCSSPRPKKGTTPNIPECVDDDDAAAAAAEMAALELEKSASAAQPLVSVGMVRMHKDNNKTISVDRNATFRSKPVVRGQQTLRWKTKPRTVFCVLYKSANNPARSKQMVERGLELGNHLRTAHGITMFVEPSMKKDLGNRA